MAINIPSMILKTNQYLKTVQKSLANTNEWRKEEATSIGKQQSLPITNEWGKEEATSTGKP